MLIGSLTSLNRHQAALSLCFLVKRGKGNWYFNHSSSRFSFASGYGTYTKYNTCDCLLLIGAFVGEYCTHLTTVGTVIRLFIFIILLSEIFLSEKYWRQFYILDRSNQIKSIHYFTVLTNNNIILILNTTNNQQPTTNNQQPTQSSLALQSCTHHT